MSHRGEAVDENVEAAQSLKCRFDDVIGPARVLTSA
jgi:hypothetical protein